MQQLALALMLGLTSLPTLAGVLPVGTVPEPGALPLLAIGAVAGLVAWARNRKKK
jgi:hypothetical protein